MFLKPLLKKGALTENHLVRFDNFEVSFRLMTADRKKLGVEILFAHESEGFGCAVLRRFEEGALYYFTAASNCCELNTVDQLIRIRTQ